MIYSASAPSFSVHSCELQKFSSIEGGSSSDPGILGDHVQHTFSHLPASSNSSQLLHLALGKRRSTSAFLLTSLSSNIPQNSRVVLSVQTLLQNFLRLRVSFPTHPPVHCTQHCSAVRFHAWNFRSTTLS